MEFKELRISDRNLFEHLFSFDKYQLSTYNFSNIFIWRAHFRIFYIILNDYLCLFFQDKHSCFMYFPPLPCKKAATVILGDSGKNSGSPVINTCFEIMDQLNSNKYMSRIENVEEKNLAFYQEYGYKYSVKPGDYLYNREDIVFLKGNKFKSKRASYNYFIKNYNFEFRPLLKQDTDVCLALYQFWVKQRKKKFSGCLYKAMLDDGFSPQSVAMENFLELGLTGYVVIIKDRVVGYTLGSPINPNTFCILFEICDLKYRGISQFIFSQFCRQMHNYQYINVMDDSELENLRKVKLSYHPICIVANYIIKKDYA